MKQIIRGYYYIFYVFYRMSEAAPSRWLSDWKAGLCIIAMEIMLLVSFLNYYNVFFDKNFDVGRVVYIMVIMTIVSINSYFFVFTNVWQEYIKEFDKLPKHTNKRGRLLVFGIALLVIIIFIYSFYLMSTVNWN